MLPMLVIYVAYNCCTRFDREIRKLVLNAFFVVKQSIVITFSLDLMSEN